MWRIALDHEAFWANLMMFWANLIDFGKGESFGGRFDYVVFRQPDPTRSARPACGVCRVHATAGICVCAALYRPALTRSLNMVCCFSSVGRQRRDEKLTFGRASSGVGFWTSHICELCVESEPQSSVSRNEKRARLETNRVHKKPLRLTVTEPAKSVCEVTHTRRPG